MANNRIGNLKLINKNNNNKNTNHNFPISSLCVYGIPMNTA